MNIPFELGQKVYFLSEKGIESAYIHSIHMSMESDKRIITKVNFYDKEKANICFNLFKTLEDRYTSETRSIDQIFATKAELIESLKKY